MATHPTPLFLPEKSPGQRSLVGYSPRDHKRVRHDLGSKQSESEVPQSCLTLQPHGL